MSRHPPDRCLQTDQNRLKTFEWKMVCDISLKQTEREKDANSRRNQASWSGLYINLHPEKDINLIYKFVFSYIFVPVNAKSFAWNVWDNKRQRNS